MLILTLTIIHVKSTALANATNIDLTVGFQKTGQEIRYQLGKITNAIRQMYPDN